MGLSWSSAELGPFDVSNKAFTQRERGPSFLVLPKRCCWAQITSQFVQVQSHRDLVVDHMLSSLAGCASVGLFRKQWHALPQTFTQLVKAGSSAKQVLMQGLTAKKCEAGRYLCDKPEYRGGQSYVETVVIELKVRRNQEGLTEKSSRLAIQMCAKWTSNISELTPSEVFQQI